MWQIVMVSYNQKYKPDDLWGLSNNVQELDRKTKSVPAEFCKQVVKN